MEKKTIYQYIIENLDAENENFTQNTLPDVPNPSIPQPLGSEEAMWFASRGFDDSKNLQLVYEGLQKFLAAPDHLRKQNLYRILSNQPMITIGEDLCKKLQETRITDVCYNLARNFFYNALHRGPVKFAYLIFGLYGTSRIEEEDPTLWEDMTKVARCEEFTYYFMYACRLDNHKPNKDIWRIIGCTEGWGKVFAIEAANCKGQEQELWLIMHGMELSVDYPPLAMSILQKVNLLPYLNQPEQNEALYKGYMDVLNFFLICLNNSEGHALEETLNTARTNPAMLLAKAIENAHAFADKPANVLQVINLRFGIENILYNPQLALIDSNLGQTLLAECDSIIYAKDWEPYVREHLVEADKLDFTLADFACELDYDIWQTLFDYFLEHPFCYEVLPYLLSYNEEEYQLKTIEQIEKNLLLYAGEEGALLVPLRYLGNNPGLGENIVIAGLTSIFDWPRGTACGVLDRWGPEYISEPIRAALKEARLLSRTPVVTARIEAVLTGEIFDMEKMLGL